MRRWSVLVMIANGGGPCGPKGINNIRTKSSIVDDRIICFMIRTKSSFQETCIGVELSKGRECVTGGTGFIGSWIIKRLVEEGSIYQI